MRVGFTLPTMRIACDTCRHTTEPLDPTLSRHEFELPCKCTIPELMLVLGFRGRPEPLRIPLNEVGR